MPSVILIAPPLPELLDGFPGALVALASYLDRHGLQDVEILDLAKVPMSGLHQALTVQLGKGAIPMVVGITTTTASYQSALAVARTIRALAPKAFIVLGGHHAAPQDVIVLTNHPEVDGVVRGEGEQGLLALAQATPLEEVPGLSWRAGDGTIRRNPVAPPLDSLELDQIPPVMAIGSAASAPGKFHSVTYLSARGCPLGCHFCAVGNDRIRAKSIPQVVADLETLVLVHGYRHIALEDNFFAANRRRTLDLCHAVAALQQRLPTRFTWDCQTRVESMKDPEVAEAMARAGCTAVYLGVESLDPAGIAYLGKATDPERYLKVLEDRTLPEIFAHGMDAYINLQVGLPGWVQSAQGRALDSLKRLGAIAQAHGRLLTVFPQLHVVYPGTRHFLEAVRTQRFGPTSEQVFEAFTAWEAEQQPILKWLGELFAHGTGGIPEGILDAARLREGHFVVNPRAVHRIEEQLRQIEAVSGVVLFKYGEFLVRTDHGASAAGPLCKAS